MSKKESKSIIPLEIIEQNIYIIRGQKVMLDRDLAMLYGIETKRLVQAVKRNIERFPEDFAFQLTKKELENWKSQFVTSNSQITMGLRKKPYVFTEQGVAMLSSVLKNPNNLTLSSRLSRRRIGGSKVTN